MSARSWLASRQNWLEAHGETVEQSETKERDRIEQEEQDRLNNSTSARRPGERRQD